MRERALIISEQAYLWEPKVKKYTFMLVRADDYSETLFSQENSVDSRLSRIEDELLHRISTGQSDLNSQFQTLLTAWKLDRVDTSLLSQSSRSRHGNL